jgi:hypothetical protein
MPSHTYIQYEYVYGKNLPSASSSENVTTEASNDVVSNGLVWLRLVIPVLEIGAFDAEPAIDAAEVDTENAMIETKKRVGNDTVFKVCCVFLGKKLIG